jgi:TNF receptor-associated factor 2/TNF receptor-associated factor 3
VSELELQLQASLASTHNGSFLWRIPDVARRRRDAIDERITSIYSPPFYTGRNGYKMCIRAYLNGDGIGYKTHFSVFFVLMRGEFDPLLKWPFEYKVSLILVDQEHRKHIVQTFKPTPESSSFRRPQSDMNIASGCPQFSKLSVLDDESYTKDDVIYLKCIVDTSRIFHP